MHFLNIYSNPSLQHIYRIVECQYQALRTSNIIIVISVVKKKITMNISPTKLDDETKINYINIKNSTTGFRGKTSSYGWMKRKQVSPIKFSNQVLKKPIKNKESIYIQEKNSQRKNAGMLKLVKNQTINNKAKKNYVNAIKFPLVSSGSNILTDHPKYIFNELIGEGAFSKVYSGTRKIDNQKCVIKLYDTNQSLSSDSKRQNLSNQLSALKLPKHQNIIGFIEHFQTQYHVGIVMEYFSQKSLLEYAQQKKHKIKSEILKAITKQICEGLLHLHSYGVSHRDIKPDNILIIESQNENLLGVKIIDFGFATNGLEEEVVVAGTPLYMPPELVNKKNYDPMKADVWALGILLYWLATGYYPQQNIPKNTTKQNIKSKKQIQIPQLHFPIDMDPGLQYLIQKILNRHPKQRITLKQILNDTWIKPRSLKAQIDKLRKSSHIQISKQIQFI